MKQAVFVIAFVALGILAGCTSPGEAYRSGATLKPAPDAGQYDLAFLIEDISESPTPTTISSPRLRVLKGKEASISVGDETNSIICTAIVEEASGQPEAHTTVTVTKDGKVVWYKEQIVALSKQ